MKGRRAVASSLGVGLIGRTSQAPLMLLLAALATASCAGEDTDPPPAPTTASTTTLATSSVTGSPNDPEQGVRADLRRAHVLFDAAYLAAVAAPGNKDRLRTLLAVYVPGSVAAQAMQQRIDDLARQGLAGRTGPRGYFVIEDIDVASADEGATAKLTVCTFDDGVVFDTRHTGPDGQPVVVNDAVVSRRAIETWLRHDGRWLLRAGLESATWRGQNRCPAPRTS